MDRDQLSGTYLGRSKAREGRESELSPQDRVRLKSGRVIPLEVRSDGTYTKELVSGTWETDGQRMKLTPSAFGGKSLEQMEAEAKANCRAFGLAFVFEPSILEIRGDALCTGSPSDLIYIEFTR